jgi:hypothetical protein
MLSATGFNNLVGMLLKRRVHVLGRGSLSQPVPVLMVLVASSAGVNSGSTAPGTAGRLVAFKAVKFPPRISEVGMLRALTRTGAKSHRRSYERRKNVCCRENGIGPPSDPPVSFRLKYGVGKVEIAGVGRKLALSTLSWVVHAASAEFLLL